MEVWISHIKPRQQTALAIGCTIVGALILYGARGFQTLNSNAGAGFLLGFLLLGLGIAAFLVSGRQSVTIDPAKRTIRIDDEGRLGRKSHTLRFDDIADIGIGYLGKKSNYVTWYYLNLKLKNGKEYPLFAPGRFYEGGSDRSVVEGWRDRLRGYVDG